MRPALVALTLAIVPAAAASAPHGPGCRLSTAEYVQVARELAIEAELNTEDARTFGLNLPAYDRAKALLRREYKRIEARTPLLPIRVGNELARLRLCAALDESAQLDGTANADPACR